MTEHEWLSSSNPDNPEKLLRDLYYHYSKQGLTRNKAARRRLRLTMCGWLRQIWDLATEPIFREGIVACEDFADGLIKVDALARIAQQVTQRNWELSPGFGMPCGNPIKRATTSKINGELLQQVRSDTCAARCYALREFPHGIPHASPEWQTTARSQAVLLRDIFGTREAPVNFATIWHTATVIAIAQQMYDAHDFALMPILGDALMDAGCDDERILAHCTSATPHTRGCWLLDLVLGKS